MSVFERDKSPESREPLKVPPLRGLDAWRERQVTFLSVELSIPSLEPANDVELVYALGLEDLTRNELEAALAKLVAVVERDAFWTYSSAKLLVLVLYRALGDSSPLTSLMDVCLSNSIPDSFAQRAIADCSLRISKWAGDNVGIQLADMHLYPAIATQFATSGAQLQLATASESPVQGQLVERARSLVAALDLVVSTRWRPPLKGERGVKAMTGRREMINGLASTACVEYLSLGDPDAALEIMSRVDFEGDVYLKANALADKGLTDAALVAYDDAIREGKKKGLRLQHSARYRKAKLLIGIGDLTRARRELARLYADEPIYRDEAGLLDRVTPHKRSSERVAVSEEIRHAVWRRDEGRCVQCGSQDSLEFDHIIPVSRGGSSTERNLQLLCERCNRAKGAAI